MILTTNLNTLDLSIMIDGTLDTIVQNVLIKYNIPSISDNLSGKNIDIKYRITNPNVSFFYNNNRKKIETGDIYLFEMWKSTDLGAFNSDFNLDFN